MNRGFATLALLIRRVPPIHVDVTVTNVGSADAASAPVEIQRALSDATGTAGNRK
jgi:hypothetical protein